MRALLVVAMLCTAASADEDGPKDPTVATGLSLGATAASYTTLALSTLALDTKYGKVAAGAGLVGVWLAGRARRR